MSERKRIVVTGLGLVCGLGNDVDTCWQKLTAGVSAIQEVRSVDTANCYAHKGAEVDLQFAADTLDRSSLLCIQAAEEAVADASIPDDKKNIGVILGSCVGGAASIDKYYSDIKNTGKGEKSDIYKMPASAIANNVSAHFGLDGVTANIVNACAAGTISIAYACDLIRAGKGDCFLAGGTDSFSSLAFSGFHALKALDADACSPFNIGRKQRRVPHHRTASRRKGANERDFARDGKRGRQHKRDRLYQRSRYGYREERRSGVSLASYAV